MSPAMMAQLRDVRLYSAEAASQASRSSPSMSWSNSLSMSAPPMSRRPQIASAYSLAEKPSGLKRRRSRRRVDQKTKLLVPKPPLERVADEKFAAAARERLDQQLPGRGDERAPLLD